MICSVSWWWSDWSYRPWNRRSYCNNLPFSGTSKASFILRGTRRCGWLSHCAASRKVRVRLLTGSLGFFIDFIRPVALWPWGRLSLKEYQGYLLGGEGGRCVLLTTLPSPCAICLEILGASTSYSPQGLSRPLQGFFYLLYPYSSLQFRLWHQK
jgi:hypothetical protein